MLDDIHVVKSQSDDSHLLMFQLAIFYVAVIEETADSSSVQSAFAYCGRSLHNTGIHRSHKVTGPCIHRRTLVVPHSRWHEQTPAGLP